MARASGPIGVVILLMSFYLIAAAAWMFLEYRPDVAMPPALVREVTDLLAEKRYTEASQRLGLDTSFFARSTSIPSRKRELARRPGPT